MTKKKQYCQKDTKAFYFFRSCLFVRIRQKPPLPKKNVDLELNAILPLIDFSLLKGQREGRAVNRQVGSLEPFLNGLAAQFLKFASTLVDLFYLLTLCYISHI